jgi:hypothetical protein
MAKTPYKNFKREILEVINEEYGISEISFSLFDNFSSGGKQYFAISGEIFGEKLKSPVIVTTVALNKEDSPIGIGDFNVKLSPDSFEGYLSFETTIVIPLEEKIETMRLYLIDNFSTR